jgi:hypothetical protein
MKRRSFLTGLCAIAPLLFLPRFEPVKWKRTERIWVPNPEYVTAPFHIEQILCQEFAQEFFNANLVLGRYHPDARFAIANGHLQEVPPYIKA